ncbi:conserved Plasmodium protein, unknown function [Plasmodium ovale]|uniref:Uncharacterized protein n=1 Tax=Plasmodium ovale TaxID=36330 RepID=A0A1D3UAW2_PLAOA|nr:conserved Plasmodium protein, unknown function [Plasmodium ovale]
MEDPNFILVTDLKPFMNNLSLQCLIIKYIDDPPDHINNMIKYHYLMADISGSVILCIPQSFIQEELKKNNIDILNDDMEDLVEYFDSTDFATNENSNLNIPNEQKKCTYDINKKTNDIKTLKCFFRIGDIIKIYGAVVMPNMRTKKGNSNEIRGSVEKVGFFSMNISLEPNVSNLITATTEKKYQMDNSANAAGRNTVTNKGADGRLERKTGFVRKNKVSKYDILPLFNDEDKL